MEEEQQGREESEEARMPMPRMSRPTRLGLLLLVGSYLYLVAVLLGTLWGVRYLERVGRTPTLVSAAAAYALFVLAQVAQALRVRPAPYSLWRWWLQYRLLLGVLGPLLLFVVLATFDYGLWWATLGSIGGFFLLLWLVLYVARWRRGGWGVREGGGQG
jgi:hypothetical protein